MRLKPDIDKFIQKQLIGLNIRFNLDEAGFLSASEFRVDKSASMCMLYLESAASIPDGELPFKVISAPFVSGVFHYDSKALIIELGTQALDDDVLNGNTRM